MERILRDLANQQGGIFTTQHAARCGVNDYGLVSLRKAGLIASMGRGVYAMTDVLPDTPVALHAMKTRAALLLYPDAQPCGLSLAALHGLASWGAPLGRVDLVRDVSNEKLTQLCRIRPPDALVRPVGAETRQSLAAAVVQMALDFGPMPAVVSADNALHDNRADELEVRRIVAALAERPYGSRARMLAHLMDGRSESVGESRLRVIVTTNGIAVTPQVVIREGGVIIGRADLGVDGTNVLLEFDGKLKYGGGDPEVLWAEKRREDRMRRQGHRFARFIWPDLDRPRLLVARVRQEIALASPRNTLPPPSWEVG